MVKKKGYKWKPISIRPQVRPKNRWEDDVRNDMKNLEIKNWIVISVNRMFRRLKYSKFEVVAPEEEEDH